MTNVRQHPLDRVNQGRPRKWQHKYSKDLNMIWSNYRPEHDLIQKGPEYYMIKVKTCTWSDQIKDLNMIWFRARPRNRLERSKITKNLRDFTLLRISSAPFRDLSLFPCAFWLDFWFVCLANQIKNSQNSSSTDLKSLWRLSNRQKVWKTPR